MAAGFDIEMRAPIAQYRRNSGVVNIDGVRMEPPAMNRSLRARWAELTLVTVSAVGFVAIVGAGVYVIVTSIT